jgi:type I restriction enzyme M protein
MAKRTSEVHAYIFIKQHLADIGWNTKNPLRSAGGEVFTQGECLEEPRICEMLNQTKPENIVKISETDYYVIEGKANTSQIDQALQEAEEDYAKVINKSRHIKARIISGLAGNENDGYLIKSKILVGNKFKPIIFNGKELTSLVSPKIARELIRKNTNIIDDLPIDEKFFLGTAEKINVILHNGAIPATERGKVISALILSLVDDTQPNLNSSPTVLIGEINARVNSVLQRECKPEFYEYIKIAPPTTTENHIKFKTALVKTIQELNNLNIRSAMNSGTDVLGSFYEVFLQYGNWAKEIGIVLTPRHVTAFAAEILDITAKDIVFDPTCGTGGFLVSAFDYVKRNSTEAEVNRFKLNNIFGIEQETSVVALAIVNMIFRGDGKNNIKEANCFHHNISLVRKGNINTGEYVSVDTAHIPVISKVLMNPPFALKTKDDKEYKFVNHALKQMQKGGLLLAILPTAEMLQKGQYLEWRKEMLKNNTLLAVITLPHDVFYGANAGTNTVAIIIKKGIPHDGLQKVLWLRAIRDGFVKRKGKRLKPKPPIVERDMLTEYKERTKQFIKDQETKIKNIPEECKVCRIDFSDQQLELVPEYYLDEFIPTYEEIQNGVEALIRETAGYLLTTTKQDVTIMAKGKKAKAPHGIKNFDLIKLCEVERKYAPYLNEVLSNEEIVPYVTTTEMKNGISLRCDTDANFKKGTVTVSLDSTCGTTFYQFEDYLAGEKTAALTLLRELKVPEEYQAPLLFYIAYLIRHKSWRYHFGRKLSEERLRKFEIPLPITKAGKIDYKFVNDLVQNCYGWSIIKGNL